jgi:hypothetical protein
MTLVEKKAYDLVAKFNNGYNDEIKSYIIYQTVDESKRCALVLVNEILSWNQTLFWENVKIEIQNL